MILVKEFKENTKERRNISKGNLIEPKEIAKSYNCGKHSAALHTQPLAGLAKMFSIVGYSYDMLVFFIHHQALLLFAHIVACRSFSSIFVDCSVRAWVPAMFSFIFLALFRLRSCSQRQQALNNSCDRVWKLLTTCDKLKEKAINVYCVRR